ncbi:pyridoxal phosphate phosphatase PHOSPHO2-like isoform X1 [Varroa jacobsoni]|uniref:Phosphatase phospho2 n=1 Tax=Varroa destructor TaxID=109461 RepID=A0A7M7JEH7_VARDE|nr:pyridoxal phosphate phosphatase PHOSPHO2-like isoform X2 [Varroa destructor]XP_022688225.1 pyridoxal phosphate phosphatase PHOSPHO2-like isoform X1 [Varroa jacobsoni]
MDDQSSNSLTNEQMLAIYQSVTGRRIRLKGGIPLSNKVLVAVDFDHTLIDDNSDTYIQKLAPDGKFPAEMRERYVPGSWTIFMRVMFRYLYENGVRPDLLLETIGEIPLLTGMREWLQTLNEYGYFEVAIISDANTVFIEHILYRQGVRHLVHEVFSNYAQFDGNGCLTIQEFHRNDWCKMCPQNLCKSKVVADYIDRRKKQGVNLNRIVYIGDGNNDYCPAANCKRGDLVLARKGFALDRRICKRPINARSVTWENGLDILKSITQHFGDQSGGATSTGTVSPSDN